MPVGSDDQDALLLKLQQQLLNRWSSAALENQANKVTSRLLHETGDWDPPAGIKPSTDPIPMAVGIPDSTTLPRDAFSSHASRILAQHDEAAWVYGFGAGYAKLRAQLAARINHSKGTHIDENWLQLTNGSAGAIDLICRCLINPGDVIITESPAYMGTLRNFRGVQAEIHSVPMDANGLDTQALQALVQSLQAQGKTIKLIYTIATFSNPTGASLTLARRLELLQIAADSGILVLDDDAYGDLYFGDQPPASLAALSAGHGVITVGSFSKVLATGLRIGWIQCTPALQKIFSSMRFAMGLNQLMVRVVSEFMQDGQLDSHINTVRQLYARKMHILADALDHHAGDFMDFSRPRGGFYLWASLHGGVTATNLWRQAAMQGVSITPGVNFYSGRKDPDGEHVRLAFSWTPIERLEEGAARIALACRLAAQLTAPVAPLTTVGTATKSPAG
ncbi:MAG: PLP-dependent aminotransferase family protein [Pseudomonadales bacterium]|nr:PLP-dependent aminotransferase family protein [Pseudomonadales bacterium]